MCSGTSLPTLEYQETEHRGCLAWDVGSRQDWHGERGGILFAHKSKPFWLSGQYELVLKLRDSSCWWSFSSQKLEWCMNDSIQTPSLGSGKKQTFPGWIHSLIRGQSCRRDPTLFIDCTGNPGWQFQCRYLWCEYPPLMRWISVTVSSQYLQRRKWLKREKYSMNSKMRLSLFVCLW